MLNLSPPRWVARLVPGITWHILSCANEVYLTFDDGPTAAVTPWVLAELAARGVKATFFCLGRNAERYPDIMAQIRAEGHAVGNHTYSHLKGFATPTVDYYHDAALANTFLHASLFRPPYGRITVEQMRMLSARYRVVLWSLLSLDYSRHVTPARCLQFVTRHVQSGDVIVFHDSLKAERNLRYALPRALDWMLANGYSFSTLAEAAPVGILTPALLHH